MPIDVREDNFKKEVIEKSFQTYVLADFWAPWCGPCRVLGPTLEKLEKDYKGAFTLVKINTDQSMTLAQVFQISSIPDVRLIKDGKVVDQFLGALSEKQIRSFLDRHITLEASSDFDKLISKNPMDFLKKIRETPPKEQPENRDELLWKAFTVHVKNKGKLEDIKEILQEIDEENASFRNQKRAMLVFLERGREAIEDLLALGNPKKKVSVLEKYLQLVENTKNEERQKVKDLLIACFYFLPPNDEDVTSFRRKLSSLLF